MAQAIERGDAQAIEDEAHLLKSASATLGALDMSELCGRIERAARMALDLGFPADTLLGCMLTFGRVLRNAP